MYKSPDKLLSQPVAAVAQPLAVADHSTGTTSVASQSCCDQPSTMFSSDADMANFDPAFRINYENLDDSADLFD